MNYFHCTHYPILKSDSFLLSINKKKLKKNESTFFPINDSSFKIVQQKRHLCKLYLTYLQKAFNYESKESLISNWD